MPTNVTLSCAGLASFLHLASAAGENLLCNGDFDSDEQLACWTTSEALWSPEDAADLPESGSLAFDSHGGLATLCLALPEAEAITLITLSRGPTVDAASVMGPDRCFDSVNIYDGANCTGRATLESSSTFVTEGWSLTRTTHALFPGDVSVEIGFGKDLDSGTPGTEPATRCEFDQLYLSEGRVIFRAGFSGTAEEP